MNKQFFALIALLAIVPGCGRKKVAPVSNVPVQGEYVDTDSSIKNGASDEDVDAFALEEDGNPFSSNAIKTEEGENLSLANAEAQSTGDSFSDSSKYGLKSVYFEFDQYAIRKDQQDALAHNAKVAKNLTDKGFKLAMEGHACDSAGSEPYNIMLSEDRAKGAADFLIAQGVPRESISTVGWGSKKKIVPFGNREQQAPNRRVEFYAYDPSQSQSSKA